MRLYCLSSFKKISPYPNITKPYDENASENLFIGPDEANTRMNLTKLHTLDYYQLTEICIGYKYIEIDNQRHKVYVIKIYRNDSGVLTFRMTRGAVILKKVDNNITDLIIATSKSCGLTYDLKMRIRCIKTTHEIKYLSKDEEEYYERYARRLLKYSGNNKVLREFAFERKEFIFDLPNQSAPKKVFDKVNELQQIITLLCHPENGSYKNIPLGARYNQQVNCLLHEKNFLLADTVRSLETKIKNFHGCRTIALNNLSLRSCKVENVDFGKINVIRFRNVNIFLETSLHPFFKNLHFSHLKELHLNKCNIDQLSDKFIKMLPVTLEILNLECNDITFISKSISKLTNLLKFILNENYNLTNDGIPFKYFPNSITWLDLMNTNIMEIPEEISELTRLRHFTIGSKILKHVSWNSISSSIQYLKIVAGGKINEFNLADKSYLDNLSIEHAGLKEIDCSKFPITLAHLSIYCNKIVNFDSKTALPLLNSLDLSFNELKSICFENLSPSLLTISFNNNHLKSIQNISRLRNLVKLSAIMNDIENIDESFTNLERLTDIYLSNNHIRALPNGFENLRKLYHFNLEKNEFHSNNGANNLVEVLWKRLPRTLKHLYLDNNDLYELPCYLGNYNIEDLHVEGCSLQYICPYIYTQWRQRNTKRTLYISNNPGLNHLSFIPLEVFPPPAYNEKQEKEKLQHQTLELVSDKSSTDTKKTTLKFKNTEKFPIDTVKKPLYNFIKCDTNASLKCKCCGICGKGTDLAIKQLMVMDFVLHIYDEEKYLKKFKFYDWTEDLFNTDYPLESKVWGPGKWKTEVRTRLCYQCQKDFKNKADKAFEENKKSRENNDLQIKKCKQSNYIEHEVIYRPLSSAENDFVNQNPIILMTNTVNEIPYFPPIGTFYPRQPPDFQHDYSIFSPDQPQISFTTGETLDNIESETCIAPLSASQNNCLMEYDPTLYEMSIDQNKQFPSYSFTPQQQYSNYQWPMQTISNTEYLLSHQPPDMSNISERMPCISNDQTQLYLTTNNMPQYYQSNLHNNEKHFETLNDNSAHDSSGLFTAFEFLRSHE